MVSRVSNKGLILPIYRKKTQPGIPIYQGKKVLYCYFGRISVISGIKDLYCRKPYSRGIGLTHKKFSRLINFLNLSMNLSKQLLIKSVLIFKR